MNKFDDVVQTARRGNGKGARRGQNSDGRHGKMGGGRGERERRRGKCIHNESQSHLDST